MSNWISGREAATLIGVSESTVYRSLAEPDVRAEQWGAEGVGWRYKPLSRRRIFQVSRRRAEQLAQGGTPPHAHDEPG
jgi:transposase